MVCKGESLQAATLRALPNCARDENLQRCFLSGDDEIAFQENPNLNQNIDGEDQYYNNKKIIDRMGAGKDELPSGGAAKDIGGGKTLPFLSTDLQLKQISHSGDRSPHADTLDIEDLEDVNSVESEQSN